ncbi:MAG: PAS domain S-box protein [Cytophagales bacterium]|jgi:PAS domain S-box-containing protein|nr:PAS domain S-box protein [Cytophagales bacterium]HRE67692.1 PAS domain S-box protein [Cyclobacteriaceae bacterium]HRG10385.1 PAS domain S-box protein [Cyclobacteriaceae bacterium]
MKTSVFRNIKISLKITALVLVLTLASVTAIVVFHLYTETINGQNYILPTIIISLFAAAMSLLFAQWFMQPLESMHQTLNMVAKGELPEKSELHTSDEFGMMQVRVDELVTMLKQSAGFAQKIGEGKFDTPFKAAGENDSLGIALLNMRNSLVETDQKEKERNWIVLGLAEAGEILRTHDSLDKLGDDIIRFTINKVNAIQGAFYVINKDENETLIELCNSFAFNRKKYLQKSFRLAEGLVGQAVAEQNMIMRTEIPSNYLSITSGILGDKKPSCILIMPLIANEEVFGVIELAGFEKFNASQIRFVQELGTMMARTIFNIKVNERTRKLLAESQAMSYDLKEKQEVLRQNAEEMQATQEELQLSNLKLEEQIEEVNHTRNRMQLLLENASEVITIYEETGTIRYISPSVETILGYTPAEMQGATDLGHVHVDGQQIYQNLFAQLKANPSEKITVQFEYKNKTGNYIWLEATGTNFMSNRAIHGYIVNSRDITERRRAEQEQRMRSKMQALSENSTDLIARLEEGSISYINPVIQSYTGKEAVTFINKKITEAHLDNSVLENWLQIVEQVNTTQSKISTEMDFPSELGKRVMQINAMPEFNEQEVLESVLVVSHDITERKLIELDIQNKNKKINDSINYAKRIQNAILPDNFAISSTLPNSFILYKPRDVVSGDFPWYVQLGEDIFIAAVDCTGHGVPGALLSLIGYFLLNDIVRSRQITNPGQILDLLDEGVTQTLKQDQANSATKDGMDIALCRINTKNKTIEYAGAHRPLYIMKNGALEEVKGNKFPIGGGVYKNQTKFTTTSLTLNAGDSVYFSSDGYPDQFGGTDGRKFGSKRMRELVEKIQHLPAHQAMEVFDMEWEEWRGTHKQTDDVLLIGIKF